MASAASLISCSSGDVRPHATTSALPTMMLRIVFISTYLDRIGFADGLYGFSSEEGGRSFSDIGKRADHLCIEGRKLHSLPKSQFDKEHIVWRNTGLN